MTRSHKFGDKDHAGLADGTVAPQEHLPKFFAKHGFPDQDPKKTKKNGAGRGNWGHAGEELIDVPEFNYNVRRRSNSSSISSHPEQFKTKFEINEPEPVFEESLHGPEIEDDEDVSNKTETSSKSDESI